ncbi:MAG TPA: sugar ABC transporter permease [Spirochaetia bacterium]|nr:sugar ABC transporter permease [Spirochaetia bacterium]
MTINKLNRGQVQFAFAMLLPIFALYAVLRIYPIIQAFYLSLTNYKLGVRKHSFVGLTNYVTLLHDPEFIRSLTNTLLFAALTLVVTLLLAFAIALVMSESRIAGIGLLQTLIFLPVVVSVVPSAIIWKWIYEPQYGILNYVLSFFGVSPVNWLVNRNTSMYSVIVFVVWRWIGYYMIIFWVGLRGVPDMYVEAATIDGASKWRIIWSIIVPLLRPIILLATVLATINGFTIFTEVYIMTIGNQTAQGNVVTVLTYDLYQRGLVFYRIGEANAEAVYLFLILIGFTLAQFAMNRKRDLY